MPMADGEVRHTSPGTSCATTIASLCSDAAAELELALESTGHCRDASSSPMGLGADSGAGSMEELQQTIAHLEEQISQVTREKDELEDLLIQEQLRNKMPEDDQVEEAVGRASGLELELQAMAAKCEEWRKKARAKAGELHPTEVQCLLEEHLEDLDESGVIALKLEVARLRDQLARSEVERLELYKHKTRQDGPRWEKEEEGLEEQVRQFQIGYQVNQGHSDGSPRWTTPLTSLINTDSKAGSSEGHDEEDVLSQLLELGEATLASQSQSHEDTHKDIERLSTAVEAAEARAAAAEKLSSEHLQRVQELEARLRVQDTPGMMVGVGEIEEDRGKSTASAPGQGAPGAAAGDEEDKEEEEAGEEEEGEEQEEEQGGRTSEEHHLALNGPLPSPLPHLGAGGLSLGGASTGGPMNGLASHPLSRRSSASGQWLSEHAGASGPKSVQAQEGVELSIPCSHSSDQQDIKDLLSQVQAQNKVTHRVLGLILTVPLAIGGWFLFASSQQKKHQAPPAPLKPKPKPNRVEQLRSQGTPSSPARSPVISDSAVILQINERTSTRTSPVDPSKRKGDQQWF